MFKPSYSTTNGLLYVLTICVPSWLSLVDQLTCQLTHASATLTSPKVPIATTTIRPKVPIDCLSALIIITIWKLHATHGNMRIFYLIKSRWIERPLKTWDKLTIILYCFVDYWQCISVKKIHTFPVHLHKYY